MIAFGSFQIDPRTWLLTSANEPVELSPRLVEILAFIVGRQGSIVTKDCWRDSIRGSASRDARARD